MSVGIDDLNVYGSTLAVQSQSIADARGVPASDLERFELVRRALTPNFEDPVTLAANAARPLVDAYGRGAFDLLIVATESGIDDAKPVGAYVHHHLGLSERCFHVETKHACFSATAALTLAAPWVEAHPGSRALIIATDMARRLFGLPASVAKIASGAEIAEGAGAVAMAITAAPRVLALEPHRGFAAREVFDVRRPSRILEVADPELSLAAYLDLLELSWAHYTETAGPKAFDELAYFLFHTPLVGLVQHAHRVLVELNQELGSAETRAHFERHVRPSVRYAQELGNIYSGSLFAALASLIDHVAEIPPNTRVGLYSYGSGSCASFFSGEVLQGAKSIVGRHGIADHLAKRRVVDVETYEDIVLETEDGLTAPDFVPTPELVPGLYDEAYRGRSRLVLERVEDHHRSYAWA